LTGDYWAGGEIEMEEISKKKLEGKKFLLDNCIV
jgi:hypothetical protein